MNLVKEHGIEEDKKDMDIQEAKHVIEKLKKRYENLTKSLETVVEQRDRANDKIKQLGEELIQSERRRLLQDEIVNQTLTRMNSQNHEYLKENESLKEQIRRLGG